MEALRTSDGGDDWRLIQLVIGFTCRGKQPEARRLIDSALTRVTSREPGALQRYFWYFH